MKGSRRPGFTLLEVVIALGILAVSLMVLVDAQATSVDMTVRAERYATATMLAKEKLTEVRLMLEREGFGDQEIEENDDFDQYGEEIEGVEFDDAYDDYRWAYTIREIELSLAGDLMGMAGDMASSGYWGDAGQDADLSAGGGQMSALGNFLSPEMITEMLSPYIREIVVRVWWGENDDGVDQVEFTTHVVNPSGVVVPGAGVGGLSGEAEAGMGAPGGGK